DGAQREEDATDEQQPSTDSWRASPVDGDDEAGEIEIDTALAAKPDATSRVSSTASSVTAVAATHASAASASRAPTPGHAAPAAASTNSMTTNASVTYHTTN